MRAGDLPALIAAVVCHELGHIAAALLAGVRVRGLRLRRGGGGLSLRADVDGASYMRALAVYAGGCIANIIAAAIFHAHTRFAAYCVGAALFNLLPLDGSDGSMMMYAMLCLVTDDANKAWRTCRAVCGVTLAVVWVTAVYMALTGRGAELLVIAVLLIVARYS